MARKGSIVFVNEYANWLVESWTMTVKGQNIVLSIEKVLRTHYGNIANDYFGSSE